MASIVPDGYKFYNTSLSSGGSGAYLLDSNGDNLLDSNGLFLVESDNTGKTPINFYNFKLEEL